MLKESYLESTIRWHLYRRWRKRLSHQRRGERIFHNEMRALSERGLFIDCGANVGDVTAAALRYGMRVIAFEPDRLALAVLEKRFSGDDRVTIIPKALGNSDRIAEFFQKPSASNNIGSTRSSSLFSTRYSNDKPVYDVSVVDIVKFLRGLNEKILVLKMDIEGAEAECLEAILDARLHESIGRILVETHERFSPELSLKISKIRSRVADEGINNINLDWV